MTTATRSGDTPTTNKGFETLGIDTIPESHRTYSPWHVFRVLLLGNLCLSVMVTGWLAVGFGLGFWSALSAVILGSIVGGVVLAPMGLLAPKTGTNNAVSSGAHFGVAGRLVGTVLGLFSAIGFTALTIWTTGDALAGGIGRLSGTAMSDGARAVCYAVVTLVVLGVAIRGFHMVVRVNQYLGPVCGLLMIVGLFAFAPHFDASYSGGTLLLGNLPATWVLAALMAASTVISYGPFIGDWARYVGETRRRSAKMFAATGIGSALGIAIPSVWGVYVAVAMAASPSSGSFALDLVAASPSWYLFLFLLLGLVAGSLQGAIGLYGTGLDTSSLIPGLSRAWATLVIAVVATAFVYLGSFVWQAQAAVSAFLVLLVIVLVPWMVVLTIGYWWRRGWYSPADLQVFTHRRRGGIYWFTAGFNVRALAAWLPAVVVGMLFSAAPPLLTGPWAQAAGGIDLSFISAGLVAAVIYTILLLVFPEPATVYGPQGPRIRARVRPATPNPAPAVLEAEAAR
ncbi:cytosine permease [Nocardia sp. BMG111209]|uniref:purine-cytosine permease family protein n=1 Tax=Nocardia sp. BMG111209 TaxID=1160137 RepID=UPI00036D051C|nr:cytosine permease [Nocardia sp. BMG111209]